MLEIVALFMGVITVVVWIGQLIGTVIAILTEEDVFESKQDAVIAVLLAVIPWALLMYLIYKKINKLP